MRISCWLLTCALVPTLLAGCGGGGGGGGGGVTFTLAGIDPAVSDDLAGGDTVTITGTNFVTAEVVGVTFGGVAGTNRVVLSETEMTVDTPPAPGGVPQSVTVVVTSTRGGTEQIDDGYTYASSGPDPQSISPTSFTPTGAEDFTITGTSLGPLGGQSTVIFAGIGSVVGGVSANGQTITGRAPVSNGVPPVGPITVTVDTGAATADVPVAVTYPYTPPILVGVPGQTPGSASQPVRLADGFAALCTGGANGTWGDADDDIRIVRGPPNAVQILSVPPRGAGAPVGFLSATDSIPAVLGPDTFCVYTVGAPTGPGVVLVTFARTAPVADVYPFPGIISAAPIAAIGPNRIAFMGAGVDALFGPTAGGNVGDDLMVMDFNLAAAPPLVSIAGGGAGRVPLAGIADATPGAANFTIPFTADGDTVIVMGAGPDALPRNADDTFTSVVISTGATAVRVGAPFLLGRPIPLSATLFSAPGAGPNGTAGSADDTLEVFSFGVGWTPTTHSLGQAISFPGAVVSYARVGNGIAVAVTAPNAVMVYTNPLAGTKTTLPFSGTPLLAPLGNGDLVVFGPGTDLALRTGDDEAFHVDDAAAQSAYSFVPSHFQAVAPLADADRAFAISPGGDGVFQTPDDVFEVYQSRSLGEARSATPLPVSAAMPAALVVGTLAFVPIGPGWGLRQSPGINGLWGDADDLVIIAAY